MEEVDVRGITTPLWLALAGSVLQFVSLGTDFYVWEGRRQSAWFGVPHTSELILLSTLSTGALFALIAANRSPIPGRKAGLIIGIVGLLATSQLGYRMVAPPFGGSVPAHAAIIGNSCLYYCLPSHAASAERLIGIWIAFIGGLMITAGSFWYALSRAGRYALPVSWQARVQPEMNPWLGIAALGAVAQFVFGYTFFTFYKTVRQDGATTWSGWLPTPHTGSLVLAVTVAVVALVWSAAREQSPLSPSTLGAMIGILGFTSMTRIAYRILQPPFASQAVEIGPAAYLALIGAALIVIAGFVQARVVPNTGKSI
jgi:hypothetical protein